MLLIPIFNKSSDRIEFSDILQLIDKKVEESNMLDYKEVIEWKGKDIGKDICGFANTNGGLLIYGVNEDRQTGIPLNINLIDKFDRRSKQLLMKRYEDFCLRNADPNVIIEYKFVEDISNPKKGIFIVYISKSDKLHNSNGIYYNREHLQIVPMSHNEVEERFRSIRNRKTATDKDVEIIRNYAFQNNFFLQNQIIKFIVPMIDFDFVLKTNFTVFILLLIFAYGLGAIVGIIPIYIVSWLKIVEFSKFFYWIGYIPIILLGIIELIAFNSNTSLSYLNFDYIFSDLINIILLIIFLGLAIPITILMIKYSLDIKSIRKTHFLLIYIKLSQEFNNISFSNFRKLLNISDSYQKIFNYWEIDPAIIEIKKDNHFLIIKKTLDEPDINLIIISLRKASNQLIEENQGDL